MDRRVWFWIGGWILAGLPLQAAEPVTQVDRLLAEYRQIEGMTCRVRRVTETPEGSLTHLSRVTWKTGGFLHVETFAPMARRYVADGERMYYHIGGDKRGFSRPLAELDEAWRISLEKVPGSPMDHLLKLERVEEEVLPSSEEGIRRFGYATESLYAVMAIDAEGRPSRLEFYEDADRSERMATHAYRAFEEVLPGVWIPARHEGVVMQAGIETKETSRFDNLRANPVIPRGLFMADAFFEGVEFVDSFEKIYE